MVQNEHVIWLVGKFGRNYMELSHRVTLACMAVSEVRKTNKDRTIYRRSNLNYFALSRTNQIFIAGTS